MKKTFKIILPILLALAIILCTVWYLFAYDREFTRDALLSGARYFENQGDHSTAQWFYNLAYDQASDNDAVAIELSEQYKEHGNYTKAEYTLYKAIQDGGGVDLYVALSKTYVEQDKLLDAVNLLNNVTGEVKQQLEEMRPAMPAVSPAPDFYNQYIKVTLTTENGTLYANTSGEYPSVSKDIYTDGISLSEGENTIYAIAVNEAGLVSPLAIYGYTVGGVIEEISFADAAIEKQIRQHLNVSDSTVLYSNDLWDITEFTVPAEAKDYSDLKYLTFLESLTIHDGVAGQLSHISGMNNLITLDIKNVSLSAEEVATIGTFSKLQSLTLNNCSISSVDSLSGLTAITYLDLDNNTVRNLSALSAMNTLQELHMQRNALTDLTDLASSSMLTKLDVSYNTISTLDPVLGLSELNWLDASQNSLTSLSGIERLANLQHLYVGYNQLTDISPVAGCTKLIDLGVGSNQLTSISQLASLMNLMYLDFSYNQVTELPAWSEKSMLVTIDGSHNLLTSIDSLAGLEALNNVYMDYNAELSSIEKLASCHVLIRVNVYGTKVTEVSALTDQSVIVNYDPTQ